MRKSNWTALAGLILVTTGLVAAGFSNPPNARNDPSGDVPALVLGVGGSAFTFAGTVLLVLVASKTTRFMPPDKKRSTNLCVGSGVILQLAGFLAFRAGVVVGHPLVVPLGLICVSLPVFVRGCMDYASGKGRSKWLGLVGVSGLLGLAILIIVPELAECDDVGPVGGGGDAGAAAPRVTES